MTAEELNALLEPVTSAVRDVGDRAASQWGKVSGTLKADQTMVTEVDRGTEQELASRLRGLLPDSSFYGEEFGLHGRGSAGLVWVCDPIDGTTNFVRGLPHWCVSVGLVEDGEPVLGVLYAPILGMLYTACRGGGMRANGESCRAWAEEVPAYENLLCASTGALKALDLSRTVCRIRCLGSIALELAMVAEGRAIAAVGLGEGAADLAAALCLCREAGAEAEYLGGGALAVSDLLDGRRTVSPFLVGSTAGREYVRQRARRLGC